MNPPLKIAIAGLGTVGVGTVTVLRDNHDLLAARCGRAFDLVAVSARDRAKDRGLDLSDIAWVDAAPDLAATEADVVIELIGGADGVALDLVRAALGRGKAVVTANKALIALHGTELARLAEDNDTVLAFEAAVAGGIPIVKALREGLAANRLTRVYGILNGTCNYMLSDMRATGRAFDTVLAEAQDLGYAEADPSFDVDGIDAAHKLAILASLAFGAEVDFDAVHVEGIRPIDPVDIAYADELGYRIKLLGIARMTDDGLEQRVHPCMVASDTPIAGVEGVLNAVVGEGDFVDTTVYEGRGAGAGPTASAVVADLIDIARGNRVPAFSIPATQLRAFAPVSIERRIGAYYIRLMVVDRPGVMADIAGCLRDHAVSMEALMQRGRDPDEAVPVVMTTHDVVEASMTAALAQIAALDSVVEPPRMIRIESL
ncbi:MAG: homoserine dehydrogenase [Alphaproteobacteria bacterium]